MMVQNRSPKRRTFPPFDENSGLSPRDQVLERIDKLLSEQLIAPFPEEGAEPSDKVEPVNPEEIMEAGRVVSGPSRRTAPAAVPAARAAATQAQAYSPPARISALSVILQGSILIFVLAWVFLLGVLIGRGHLLESGAAHELIVWIEQKAGWDSIPEPEIVLNQGEGTTAPAAPASTPAPVESTAPANSITAAAEENEEEAEEAYPVWNWPGWEPPAQADEVEPPASLPSEARVASAARTMGLDADSITAGTTRWAADGGEQPAETIPPPASAEPEAQGEAPPAEPGGTPSIWSWSEPAQPAPAAEAPTPAAVTTAEPAPAEENYPPATEPVEADEDDVPASMSPLAPAMLDGPAPGMGKFAVQVALAFDEEEAQRRVSRLESQGFTAYFYKNPGGRYPVRVGHFATRQDADTAKLRLEQLGYNGPYVSSLSN